MKREKIIGTVVVLVVILGFMRCGEMFWVDQNGWNGTGRGIIEKHRKILDEEIRSGGDSASEPVLGESLALMGYTYVSEGSRMGEIGERISDTISIEHEHYGVLGESGFVFVSAGGGKSYINLEDDEKVVSMDRLDIDPDEEEDLEEPPEE